MNEFSYDFFENVFHQNYDRLYASFLKKTGSTSIAQELTQLSFVKFWEYRYAFTFELPVELQLNRKAKLVFIDWLRKEAYQRKLVNELKKHNRIQFSTDKFEITDTLQAAINTLPHIRKKVFCLAYIDGFSHKEIATMLGISVKTVDAHILKALQQLRRLLAFCAILSVITA